MLIVHALGVRSAATRGKRGFCAAANVAGAKNRSLTVAALIAAAILPSAVGSPLFADEPRSAASAGPAAETPGATNEQGKDSEATTEGLWPSKRLLRSLLARRAEDISRQQGFDDEQKSKTRAMIVDEWSEFLSERRDQLQPLLNEFLEMRLDVDAPAKERVQAWAEKAGPVFDQLRERAAATMDGLRNVVKPEQRIAFEAEAIKLKAGLALAETKLQQWRSGEFDPKEFWEPLPSDRRSERTDRDAPRTAEATPSAKSPVETDRPRPAVPETEDQIALELKLWDRYVAEFSEQYRLDPAQRDAVRSCLSEMKERATSHRDRHREDIAALERRIAASRGGTDEVEAIRRDVIALYGPVDDLFAELKRRIEPVPTSEQREAAEQRGNAGVPASKNP